MVQAAGRTRSTKLFFVPMVTSETNVVKGYWKGIFIGFLFGTLGLFVLSMLSLALQPFEVIGSFLFAPGRALSSLLFGANGSDGAVALLMLFNGIFYALVGFVLQFLWTKRAPA